MAVYPNASMTSYFPSETPSETYPCNVRIDGAVIVITYRANDGSITIYNGRETGIGHYKLTMEINGLAKGRATLHRLNDDEDLLEGSWYEEGQRGMWEIDLNREDD